MQLNPHRGRLYFGRRSGFHLPESQMLEVLFDDLIILDEGNDLHPPLALRADQGVHLNHVSHIIEFLNPLLYHSLDSLSLE